MMKVLKKKQTATVSEQKENESTYVSKEIDEETRLFLLVRKERNIMGEMSLMEHLEELRVRIIKTLCAFVVLLIVSFVFVQDIYQWLVKDLDGKLAVLGPSEIVWIYMVIAFVFALAFTLPVAAYQVFQFVSPGLKKEEYKVLITFIPFFFILFVSGWGSVILFYFQWF